MQSLPAAGSEVIVRRERWRVVRSFRHGPVVEIDAGRATFFLPFDRISLPATRSRPRRVRPQRWRALVDHARATAESFELPLAALTAAIDLLPHQLEPWLAASSGRRRLLIADEVGLGKTIEAGLIVAEALRRARARRVLIVAPATLCEQWRQELHDRFAIAAMSMDAESLRRLGADLPRDVNPWSLDGVQLTSIDFVKQPHIAAALPPEPWDLVVFDEAHLVCGDSARHEAADAIARHARQVLLLTATPHSGDETAARRLERLGALGDEAAATVFRRTRLDIGPGPLRRARRIRVRIAPIEAATLDLLGRFGRTARDAATSDTRDAAELLIAIFNKRALSTFGALRLSIERRLAFLDAGAPSHDADQLVLSFDDGDEAGLVASIGLAVDRERNWLRRLRAVAVAAARIESKVERLRRLIARTTEPAIVFTEFRDSLGIVERSLGDVADVSVAHGGLSSRELAIALGRFRSGASRVLIATDVASQGLNLQQRCRWVIHLDRPWNPVRLEQRAGRVDRLGQARDVHLTELMTSHDREFELAERVERRSQAAATSAWLRPCGRWERRGRAAARVLAARRARAAAWRGPAIGRPVKTTSGVVSEASSVETTPDVVFTLCRTNILSSDGRLCEQVISRGHARVAARLQRLARLEAGRAANRVVAAPVTIAAPLQLTLPGSGAETAQPPRAPAPSSFADPSRSFHASPPQLLALASD
ncbi:MAG: DEAD/DEAH box helicase [Acidobacteria bacterium]|nr:MAG: DEAD/DEAH box helicase [Acidobacteriota bacterium]